VRLSLRGRDPGGTVDPKDYDATVADLCALLESWAPIQRAWPRASLFQGPCVEDAPDIILELALENGYSYNCLRTRGGPALRGLDPTECCGGAADGMTGSHRHPGILVRSDPVAAPRAALQDVAPTALDALEVPAPPMDGRSLFGGKNTLAPAAYAAPAFVY